jgi:AraC-like DNA-binding protein
MAFLRVLLLIICEVLLQTEPIHKTNDVSTDRDKTLFHQFLDLLSQEQQKRQQVNYYAEKLCITPKYLSTVCRKVSGKSPIHWITDCVMEDCYQLLRSTDLTVKEISNKLGFPNSSFFGQYFREHAGLTPIEYRTKNAV